MLRMASKNLDKKSMAAIHVVVLLKENL